MNRKDVRKEIAERILELKTRRNTYTDIALLPLELLVDIFLLVRDNRPPEEWHQITHVCRYWRDTAINAPILWTQPLMRSQNYTTLMLERSKTANLNIFLGPQVSTVAITAISSHIGRIQVLKMVLSTDQAADACDRLGASGHIFSRLESLDIELLDVPTNWIFLSTVNVMGWSTSLHSLHLKGCIFDWQMPSSLNLTSLRLTSIHLTGQISVDTLLHTLRCMPRLQCLVLALDDLILPHNVPIIEVSKVALPHLKSLEVSDIYPQRLPSFLSFLWLPKLHRLQIDSYTGLEGDSYSLHSLKMIATTLANGDFQDGVNLLVKRAHISILSMAGGELVDIWLSGTTNFDRGDRPTQQLLKQITPIFPDLVQVTIEISLNSDELIQNFGTMHQLKAVTVYMNGTLISALTGALAHRPGQEAPAFSSLDTIGFDEIHWGSIDPDMVADWCNVLLQRSNYATAINAVYWNVFSPPQCHRPA